MTPDERAVIAGQLIDNPLWDEAFTILRDAYLAKAMALGPEHDIERYKFIEALRQIDVVKTQIERTFEIGAALAKEIADTEPENVFRLPAYAREG